MPNEYPDFPYQLCSRCDGFMEKFKMRLRPVCQKCQRERYKKVKQLRKKVK